MLDENLPNFFLKPNLDGVKHHDAFYFSQHGTESEPTYDVHRLDPNSQEARNTYAVALFDSHNPDVLFGEVLLKPGWTQPTLSQDEIRKNGGVVPPPQPLLPTAFTVRLYEPDQQIEVAQKTSSWSNTNWYEFSMPQQTFRAPSSSALDRSRNDPSADSTIPKMNFVWRRESRMSKDMTCFLTGKSTDQISKKKKHKEPDIAVALFKGLSDISIYESNLHRVEIEDHKGLELVVLLSAAVIKDVYFGNIKETFHVSEPNRKPSYGKAGAFTSPIGPNNFTPPSLTQSPPPLRPVGQPIVYPGAFSASPNQPAQPSWNDRRRQSLPPLKTSPVTQASRLHHAQPTIRLNQAQPVIRVNQSQPTIRPQPAAVQPSKQQWEIDTENARIHADHERARKLDEAAAKRVRKQQEAADKERRKKQADIDKETERLKKVYGMHGQLIPSTAPSRHHNSHQRPYRPQTLTAQIQPQGRPQPQALPAQAPPRPVQSTHWGRPIPPTRPVHTGWHAHTQTTRPAAPPQQYFGGGGMLRPDQGQTLSKPKRSFFGLKASGVDAQKIHKKKSSMF